MNGAFELAAGTVTGRDHVFARRNNQDAFCTWSGDQGVIAVVADGCGSGRASEVGARLGARLVIEALRRRLARRAEAPIEVLLESVRLDVLESLRRLAADMGGQLAQSLSDYLLFTVVGAVLTDSEAFVFVLGDGVVVVNDDAEVIACDGNSPPYLAYGLTHDDGGPRFQVRRALPVRDVDSILIGTDGVADLMAVEPLRRFWEDDQVFRNPAGITRRLALLNRDVQRIDWAGRRVERRHGLLPDDTTLVVLRRKRP